MKFKELLHRLAPTKNRPACDVKTRKEKLEDSTREARLKLAERKAREAWKND